MDASDMPTTKRERLKLWAETWQRAAPLLEEQKRLDIQASDTVRAVRNLGPMNDLAAKQCPPGTTSGLVEAQRWFMLARSRNQASRMRDDA